MQAEDVRDTVRVKMGNFEFEASGSEASVKEKFAVFMAAVASAPQQAAGPAVAADKLSSEREPSDSAEVRKRVFGDKGGVIILRALPTGDEAQLESLLLLLEGHRLAGEEDVSVTALLDGLKYSGAPMRVPLAKLVASTDGLITRTGVKRGTRYGLTARGAKRAEEVLMHLV